MPSADLALRPIDLENVGTRPVISLQKVVLSFPTIFRLLEAQIQLPRNSWAREFYIICEYAIRT